MLSIHNLGAASGPSGRYYTSLGREDYYTEGGEPEGQWFGRSSTALGLTAGTKVKPEHLQAVLEGRSPVGAPIIVAGAGSQRRGGWDCTFSTPKSVSLAWALGTEEQRRLISSAQKIAVSKALSHLEHYAAFARRGHAGAIEEGTDGLLIATFEHSTSRSMDPQLHTHALITNLAQRTDGTWGGIESRYLYEWKMATGAIYRAALAENIRGLGYPIEIDKDSFRIVGIPQSVDQAFSKRRRAIEHLANQRGVHTSKGLEMLALETRELKPAINRNDLFRDWGAQATALGLTREQVRILSNPDHIQCRSKITPPSISDILLNLTSNTSVFRMPDIWRAVATHGIELGWSYERISDYVHEINRCAELIQLTDYRGQDIYSTREMLQLEKDMATRANALNQDGRHALPTSYVEATLLRHISLSEEQMSATRHVCHGGSLTAISGLAGTGKSTVAGVIREAYEQNGYSVVGAALSGKAADGLQQGAAIQSSTLHALLHNIERRTLTLSERHVVVLDEASMVGSRQMSVLLTYVEKAHAKIVLIGDEKQLQAIDAGGAFRAITQRIGAAQLVDIRRQKEGWARQMNRPGNRGGWLV